MFLPAHSKLRTKPLALVANEFFKRGDAEFAENGRRDAQQTLPQKRKGARMMNDASCSRVLSAAPAAPREQKLFNFSIAV
jgi:hypothetical protein